MLKTLTFYTKNVRFVQEDAYNGWQLLLTIQDKLVQPEIKNQSAQDSFNRGFFKMLTYSQHVAHQNSLYIILQPQSLFVMIINLT